MTSTPGWRRIAGIIDERILGLWRGGRFGSKRAVAVQRLGAAAGMEVIKPLRRVAWRPLVCVPPDVLTQHVGLYGGPEVPAVAAAVERVVEPLLGLPDEFEGNCLEPALPDAVILEILIKETVTPRADEDLRLASGSAGAMRSDVLEVAHLAIEHEVVPPGNQEGGGRDVLHSAGGVQFAPVGVRPGVTDPIVVEAQVPQRRIVGIDQRKWA